MPPSTPLEPPPGSEVARVLGVDLGSRRVGVAMSDTSATLATPFEVLERKGNNDDRWRQRLREVVDEYEVDTVVVGMPLSLDGSEGPAARRARREIDRLGATLGVPVATYDERLTTVTAERMLGDADIRGPQRRAVVDKVAAAVILQSWLDERATDAPAEDST